jgi:hypothetical protein
MAGDPRIAKTSTSGTPAVIQKTPDISKDLMLTLLFSSVNRTLENRLKFLSSASRKVNLEIKIMNQ